MSGWRAAALLVLAIGLTGCQRGCGRDDEPEAPTPDPAAAPTATFPELAPLPGSPPVEALKAAAEQQPDNPAVRQQLALGLARAQQTDDAVKEFEKVAELRPGVGTLMDLGVAYAMAKRYDDAVQIFERVLTMEPGHAEALHSLGNVAATRGEADKAMQYFQKALDSNPEHVAARFNVALLLQSAGDDRGAYGEYVKILEREPTNPSELAIVDQALFQTALLDIKHGASPRAEEALRVLLEANPKHPVAHQVLGDLLLRQGRTEEAQAMFEQQKQLGAAPQPPPAG